MNKISNEIIGNIDQSRIINANYEPHNWLSHGRDYNEQRYSPLDQINTETIQNLELEWSLDMGTTRGLEATPIVDNGIMFVSSTWSVVHAVDAKTGEVIWEINTLIDKEKDYTITGAPRVANGKVFIGNGGADMGGVRVMSQRLM